MMAFAVGLLILVMATTDTEHPPAPALPSRWPAGEWTPEVFGGILGSIVLMGVIKLVLRRHLRDLL